MENKFLLLNVLNDQTAWFNQFWTQCAAIVEKVLQGITTLEEIMRVTQEDQIELE